MFDTIQRNNNLTQDWAILLIQLISNGIVDVQNNRQAFRAGCDSSGVPSRRASVPYCTVWTCFNKIIIMIMLWKFWGISSTLRLETAFWVNRKGILLDLVTFDCRALLAIMMVNIDVIAWSDGMPLQWAVYGRYGHAGRPRPWNARERQFRERGGKQESLSESHTEAEGLWML